MQSIYSPEIVNAPMRRAVIPPAEAMATGDWRRITELPAEAVAGAT